MKIVDQEIEVTFFNADNGMSDSQIIEMAGRNCYQSEPRGDPDRFIKSLIERGHHSVLEFGYAVAEITTDRGVMAELTRHRIASFAIESSRYCNYSKDRFGSEIVVIEPFGLDPEQRLEWLGATKYAESCYLRLVEDGTKPEIARSVLPLCLKADIVVGANLREWRHIFNQRCSKAAHPMIRSIMIDGLRQFYEHIPVMFEDIVTTYLTD